MTPLQKITALLFLLFAAAGAFACDPAQGSGQCGFIGANGWVATKEGQAASYLQPSNYEYALSYTLPPQKRESRYGAFAVYPNLSGLWDSHKMFASVHGLHSKENARKRALQECKRKSGHICQVFDYADQCFSVTMGEDSEGLKIFSAVSPQPRQAPLDAMQQCIAAQGKDCEFVVQEECSLPQ